MGSSGLGFCLLWLGVCFVSPMGLASIVSMLVLESAGAKLKIGLGPWGLGTMFVSLGTFPGSPETHWTSNTFSRGHGKASPKPEQLMFWGPAGGGPNKQGSSWLRWVGPTRHHFCTLARPWKSHVLALVPAMGTEENRRTRFKAPVEDARSLFRIRNRNVGRREREKERERE